MERLEPRNLLATLVVTSAADTVNSGDGVLTFREAIQQANSLSGVDQIHFAIPGSGVQTIRPTSELPALTDPVTIDGQTSPNFAGTPVIELDGSLAGSSMGLIFDTTNSLVRGLVVNRFERRGIHLRNASAVTVSENYIGTDATGQIGLGNAFYGISVFQSNNNVIADNLISGNGFVGGSGDGIRMWQSAENRVIRNYIGVNVDGSAPIGNNGDGVHLRDNSDRNVVGGSDADRNLISGNLFDGVEILNATSSQNVVSHNYIGVDPAGTTAIPNLDGVELDGSVDNEVFDNLLSGNTSNGVEFFSSANQNEVYGNLIGTDFTGTVALANGNDGILVSGSSFENLIGGRTEARRNVVSGNGYSGVQVFGANAFGNVIEGNFIGTDINGSYGIANVRHGVELDLSPDGVVGGIEPGASNLIAFNGRDGVMVWGDTGVRNLIRGNSIHSNVGLGIDLANNGVTVNDGPFDSDFGPNGFSNYPVLDDASAVADQTVITGAMQGLANHTYIVDFYTNSELDASNYGEGETFIGTTTVTTNGSGIAAINTTVPITSNDNTLITATATDSNDNTSEFSPNIRVGTSGTNLAIEDVYLTNGLGERVTEPVIGERLNVRVEYVAAGLPPSASYQLSVEVDGIPLESMRTEGAGLGYSEWTLNRIGWYARDKTHQVHVTLDATGNVAESDESDNAFSFSFDGVSASDLPQKFVSPVPGTPFRDWRITGYVDLDPRTDGNRLDYGGGAYTYDTPTYNHDAIDLGPGNFRATDVGIPIYAAADGVVTFTRDGNFDREVAWRDPPATSNVVRVDHGAGWQTVYVHMRRDSVAVQVGEEVKAGDFLGYLASSGNSTGPHIHFEIEHHGRPVETFLDPETFWLDPWPYAGVTPAVLSSGTTSLTPTASESKEGITRMSRFPFGQRITQWHYVAGQNDGDTRTYRWYRPDGTLYHSFTVTQSGLTRGSAKWGGLTVPAGEMSGVWHAAFEQNGVELGRTPFVVGASVSDPEIRVQEGSDFISDDRVTPIDYGSRGQFSGSPSRTFTISNQGFGTLNLGSVSVPDGFTVVGAPPSTLAVGGSATLVIAMDTSIAGYRMGQVRIGTNDSDESVFNFPVEGTVTSSGLESLKIGLSERRAAEGRRIVGNVRRSGDTTAQLVVNLASNDGSEITLPDSVVIPIGSDWINFAVDIPDDSALDGQQDVVVTASASGFADATALLTTIDAPLSVSIADATMDEGDTGTGTLSFDVTLSEPPSQTIKVNVHLPGQTGSTQELTFAQGQTQKTFDVAVVGDVIPEGDEVFYAVIESAEGAEIIDHLAVGRIINDDAPEVVGVVINDGANQRSFRRRAFRHFQRRSGIG